MATVTGNAKIITNGAFNAGRITVRSYSKDVVVGAYVIVAGNRTYTSNADGSFSLVLVAGDYEVIFDGVTKFIIAVPTGSGTHEFTSLITSTVTTPSTLTAGWPSFPAGARWVLLSTGAMYAKNLTTGLYHEVSVDGDTNSPYLQLGTPGAALPS